MVDAAAVGFAMIIAGAVIIFVQMARTAGKGEGRAKGAAVILVGPIPIAFGSDAKWTGVAIGLAIVLLAVALIFRL